MKIITAKILNLIETDSWMLVAKYWMLDISHEINATKMRLSSKFAIRFNFEILTSEFWLLTTQKSGFSRQKALNLSQIL